MQFIINKVYEFVSDNFTKTEIPESVKGDDTEAYQLLMKFRRETFIVGWIFGPPLLFIYSYIFVSIITSILITIVYVIFTKIISKRWNLYETLILVIPPSAFIVSLLAYHKLEERRRLEFIKEIHES